MKKGRPANSILLKGEIIDLTSPVIMGILNITNDSFYSGSRATDRDDILKKTEKHLLEGATFIDIGGYSSRPGAIDISYELELERVMSAVTCILEAFPETIISVDTFRASVAKEAIQAGASIINDISAAEDDMDMPDVMAELNVPVILMHKQGKPSTMQLNPQYADVTTEVISYLLHRTQLLKSKGVKDIIWDPGFGFGKTLEHNYQLLRQLGELSIFGFPILAGISRKSMITKVLNIPNSEALNGTTAMHMLALQGGAKILRAHDVKEAAQCIRLFEEFMHTDIP